jgi:hypothetical protein
LAERGLVLRTAIDAIFVGGSIFEYQAGDVAANGLDGTFFDADLWRGLRAGGVAVGDVVVSLSEFETGLKWLPPEKLKRSEKTKERQDKPAAT